MNFILRAYSFLFLLPPTLLLFAMGAFAYLEGRKELTIDMLPWAEADVRMWLVLIGGFGLLSMLLALRKKARVLFAIHGVIAFVLSIYAVFLSRHRFDGETDFFWGLAFVAGALGAMLGAMVHARK
ncbi:MAG: hypothetical protein JNL62_10110 [Bryobacterales bacterium]|nr:hypothetical protein [Bryobacterales bacterium]